jgi:triacylglycerol lipase
MRSENIYSLFFTFLIMLVIGCTVAVTQSSPPTIRGECVILLHGLARTSRSMEKMKSALVSEGFRVVNMDYPSRHHRVEDLALTFIPITINDCGTESVDKIHFVTHSVGGILVRYYLIRHELPGLGRVVMLSPPNQGTEIVDKLKNVPGIRWFNGPAFEQLGTDDAGIAAQLPPVDYEVGVIAGDRTINFINSMLIPGKDDGKVSVKRTKVLGMTDFLITHHSHPFMMKAKDVIDQTIYFLHQGRFNH